MIKVKTKTGFKAEIDERITSDWRVVKNIALAESSNPVEQVRGSANLVTLILGDNEDAFIEHIASVNDGFVPTSAVTAELADIIRSAKETKN